MVEVCELTNGKLSLRHVSDVKQVTPLECTVQLIPETTGMGHKCTLTVNPDRITDYGGKQRIGHYQTISLK